MNDPLNTTEGAPVITAAETVVAPAAKTTKRRTKKPSAAVTIARRKVMAGQHKKTGAPKLTVLGLTKNPRKGPFTLSDIFGQNGETISMLTIKKRKAELIDAGQLVIDTVAAKRQHTGHGRPPQFFNFDLTQGTVKVKKAKSPRKGKTKAAPVVAGEPVVPAPVIAEAQAPAEQAAPAPVEAPAPAVAGAPAAV